MTEIYVNDVSLCCALGDDVTAVSERLRNVEGRNNSPLRVTDLFSPDRPVPLGLCDTPLPPLPPGNTAFECRNNQLLWHLYCAIETGLQTLVMKSDWNRVGLILGTSTSGIQQAEFATAERLTSGNLPANFHFTQQQLSGGGDFLLSNTAITGPAYTVSTACSSSAHALASGKRMIEQDLCDIVIAGGVDTLCQFTVQGFSALEAVSPELTNPYSANRSGINLGEGGALFVLSRYPSAIRLMGVGASTDAHHISAPHPEGRGAIAAMTQALANAGLTAKDIDYVNLHGTGTGQNDSAEGLAVNKVFGDQTPCSSTKPLTGHTLGAAGIVEAALCWMMLSREFNPERKPLPHIYDGEYDSSLPPLNLSTPDDTASRQIPIETCLSNSFAFGGNNAAIILRASRP